MGRLSPNVPAAPVGCDTCGAPAGARCRTGMGSIAVKMHAARARAVTVYYEGVPYPAASSNVVSLDKYRARKARTG